MTPQEAHAIKAQKERVFIERRLLMKQWTEMLLRNVKEMDPRYLEGLTIPAGTTAEEVLPSMFADKFDEAQYKLEVAPLEALAQRLNETAAKLNEEARKWL